MRTLCDGRQQENDHTPNIGIHFVGLGQPQALTRPLRAGDQYFLAIAHRDRGAAIGETDHAGGRDNGSSGAANQNLDWSALTPEAGSGEAGAL